VITSNPSTFFTSMVARVGGGFINEIPTMLENITNDSSVSCYKLFVDFGQLFSLVFNYYI